MKTLLRILFPVLIIFTLTSEAAYAAPDPDSIESVPTIHLVSPNGGEQWIGGSYRDIVWTGTNLVGYVLIEYSFDNGNNWSYVTIGSGTDVGGSTQHEVPSQISQNVKVRVSSVLYPEIFDISDNFFSIVDIQSIFITMSVAHTYPDSRIYIYYIAPEIQGIHEVNILFSTDYGSTWQTIASDLDLHPSYSYTYKWDVPNTLSDSCLIKVVDTSDPSIYGLSIRFKILPIPTFSIQKVNPDQLIHTDSSFTLEYTKTDQEVWYYLSYSSDYGNSWIFMNYLYLDHKHGSIRLEAPSEEIDSCLYRIANEIYPAASDTTGYLTIRNYAFTPICKVSSDPSTNKNLIKWSKPQSVYISEYIIYRETDTTEVYEEIGRVNKNSPGEFLDLTSKSDKQAYRYCLSYVDTEGRIYPFSAPHQTIHLSAYKSNLTGYNLIWSPYIGADVQSYTIYRGTSVANLSVIATLSGNNTSYTDFNAPTGTVIYQISASGLSNCSGGNFSSSSNIASESALGIFEDTDNELFTLYPNPAKDKIYISSGKPFSSLTYSIAEISGRILLSHDQELLSGSTAGIDLSGLNNGVYLLHVKTVDFTATKKIIINR
jgi:hypothetical protein